MRQRPSYFFAGEAFPTKDAVARRARGILSQTPVGTMISGQDLAFVVALLQQHPGTDWGAYTVAGVTTAFQYGTKCFRAYLEDGRRLPFSYKQCITPRTHRAEVSAAFRRAISAQIDAVRRAGSLVGGEVDHVAPATFQALLARFLAVEALTEAAVRVHYNPNAQIPWELSDHALCSRWEAYHRAHAVLELVTAEEHARRTVATTRGTHAD